MLLLPRPSPQARLLLDEVLLDALAAVVELQLPSGSRRGLLLLRGTRPLAFRGMRRRSDSALCEPPPELDELRPSLRTSRVVRKLAAADKPACARLAEHAGANEVAVLPLGDSAATDLAGCVPARPPERSRRSGSGATRSPPCTRTYSLRLAVSQFMRAISGEPPASCRTCRRGWSRGTAPRRSGHTLRA